MPRLGYAAQRGFGKGIAYGMWWGAGVGAAAGIVDASIKAYNGKIDAANHVAAKRTAESEPDQF